MAEGISKFDKLRSSGGRERGRWRIGIMIALRICSGGIFIVSTLLDVFKLGPFWWKIYQLNFIFCGRFVSWNVGRVLIRDELVQFRRAFVEQNGIRKNSTRLATL